MSTKLTKADHARHVATVDKGLGTFVEVGLALKAINDSGSYKKVAGFKTFAAFVNKHWGMSTARAYQLIGSSQIADHLISSRTSTKVDIAPLLETQVRPLLALSKPDPHNKRKRIIDLEKVDSVWAEAEEKAEDTDDDGRPIMPAKHIQETVDFWKAADEPYKEPEPEPFDYDTELDELFENVRALIDRCPDDYRSAFSQALSQLSDEARPDEG